jgi:hypothetical protein
MASNTRIRVESDIDALQSAPEQSVLKPSEKDEDFDFAADFASQFEEAA